MVSAVSHRREGLGLEIVVVRSVRIRSNFLLEYVGKSTTFVRCRCCCMSLMFNSLKSLQIILAEGSCVHSKSMFSMMWSTNTTAEGAQGGCYTSYVSIKATRRGWDSGVRWIKRASVPSGGSTGTMVGYRLEQQ